MTDAKHCSYKDGVGGRNSDGSEIFEDKSKSEEMGVVRKMMLCAELLGNEASATYKQLYSIPVLQTLGMPLGLATMTGVFSGPAEVVLMPISGWLTDKGSNPNRRKLLAVAASTVLMATGILCVIVACFLHLQLSADRVQNPLDDGSSGNTLDIINITGTHNLSSALYNNSLQDVDLEGDQTDAKEQIPFKAWLALAGFIIFELGYDQVNCFVRAWVLTCGPRAEHTSLLVTGLVMSAIGGVLVAALGMADFALLRDSSGFGGTDSSALVVQSTIQGIVSMALLLLGMVFTLVSGYALLRQHANNGDCDITGIENTTQDAIPCENVDTAAQDLSATESTCLVSEKTSATSTPKPLNGSRQFVHRGSARRAIFLICVSMCFCCAAYFMFAMMPDYVGKAIFGGVPNAPPGSPRLESYSTGVRTATSGFLIVSVVSLVVNLVHKRLLNFFGHKAEYVLVQFLMGGIMVLQALTARIEVFYIMSAVAGLHRAARYVIPYAAANDVIQAEKERTNGPRVGLVMSLVSGMMPLSMAALRPWGGVLEEWTGLLEMPLWLGATFAGLSALFFVVA